jgi:hypothetical protein
VEPAGLEVKLLERGGERLVFLVNHGQAPAEARVWLALDPSTGWSGADLASGAPVASTPGPGGLWLPVRVGPMDAQVVHLVRN